MAGAAYCRLMSVVARALVEVNVDDYTRKKRSQEGAVLNRWNPGILGSWDLGITPERRRGTCHVVLMVMLLRRRKKRAAVSGLTGYKFRTEHAVVPTYPTLESDISYRSPSWFT
jgi:hypothetical protein